MAIPTSRATWVTRNWSVEAKLAYYTDFEPSGCHLFRGGTRTDGYGHLVVRGRARGAHRWAWEVANGPIPTGMFVCHRCDVPLCINPDHLFLGTHTDNVADRQRKGRQSRGEAHLAVTARGEAHGNATLTALQVREIRVATGTLAEIGKRYGVSPQNIHSIRQGRLWTHV